MKNPNKKQSLLLALPIIATIALIPWATSDVFAQDANVDVVTDVAPDIADVPDRRAEVMFSGMTDGWAIVGGQAYPASIEINGNAYRHGNGAWKVTSDAIVSIDGEIKAELDLKGKAVHGKLRLHGSGTLEGSDEPFRIFLRGHYAPIAAQSGDFVLAFGAAKVHNMETGARIPLIQSGIVTVEPVDPSTDDYDRFIADFDVKE